VYQGSFTPDPARPGTAWCVTTPRSAERVAAVQAMHIEHSSAKVVSATTYHAVACWIWCKEPLCVQILHPERNTSPRHDGLVQPWCPPSSSRLHGRNQYAHCRAGKSRFFSF